MNNIRDINNKVIDFYNTSLKSEVSKVQRIKQSGSNRKYFRIFDNNNNTKILAYNPNIKENETFIYYTEVFLKLKFNVPKIFDVSNDKSMYILEDLGDTNLLELVEQNRNNENINENIINLYKTAISELAKMQIIGHKNIDYSKSFAISEFNKDSILFDLNYFKYYFLSLNNIKYDEQKLQNDFLQLADNLNKIENKYFMYRDFQARNIMIFNNKTYFIDYQGGRKGAIHYDIASLLFQAKANIPENIKNILLDFYIDEISKYIKINKDVFKSQFHAFALLRILQTLGAYANRGIIEKKTHFIQSIPNAIRNLKKLIEKNDFLESYKELTNVCNEIIESKIFNPIYDDILTIRINSFSYKNNIPNDPTLNGGGFVFDCRGIYNPGRFPKYKNKTGLDIDVIDFLKTKTNIDNFINDVYKVVEYNINDYLKRDFKSLMISFGCTGGQHRSVYCAEQIAQIIKKKYPVKILLTHVEQNIYKEIN